MKRNSILAFLIISLLLGCATVNVNRGVTDDNVYYSEKNPSVRIRIDKRFVYSPKHPVTRKHNCEFFLNENTGESVFIKIYRGNYEPENSFSGKNMVSVEKKNILGKMYYIGTEIFKDHDGYYLKRIHLHYPNQQTMLVVMHTVPLKLYGEQYDWSKKSTFTEKQKRLIDEFIIENTNIVHFVNY